MFRLGEAWQFLGAHQKHHVYRWEKHDDAKKNQPVVPRLMSFSGMDLYEILDRKCGGAKI
jgi:hypothetical protein